MKSLSIAAMALALAGCSAVGTVANLATMPVRGAAKAVDVATVSQSERDEARGRELRRRDERLGELERIYLRNDARCQQGDAEACVRRDSAQRESQALTPSLPHEPQ